MLFSINYSTQAAVLYRTGRIEIDRFKCPDWPHLITEAGKYSPVAVHYTLSAGRKRLRRKDLDLVERISDQTGTPFINLHLEAKLRDYPGVSIDFQNSKQRSDIISQAVREVDTAVKRFGADRVIIENVPYRPKGNVFSLCSEPDFIHQVARQTGCGFLLDIPHALISARHLQYDLQAYLSALPVHCLKELHFTGVHAFGNWLQDHSPAEPDDWEAFDWVVEQIRSGWWPKPWMIAYEVGGVGEKFSWRTPAQSIENDARRIFNSVKTI